MHLHIALIAICAVFCGSAFASTSKPNTLPNSDWLTIREAYKGERHKVRTLEDGTHTAHNMRQEWDTEFDGRGFIIRPAYGDWAWGMELQSVGGEQISGKPIQSSAGNTFRYRWSPQIEEWFINDQRGLEQGWTIRKKGNSSESLRLDFSLRGGLLPSISSDGTNVFFADDGTSVLTYGGLKAWDANDRPLKVRFVAGVDETRLSISVDDSDATYPITIDPVAELAYLKASNAGVGDYFGYAVAISGDTVIVGAPYEDGNSLSTLSEPNDRSGSSGAAYVFVRNGETWSQQAYLKASNAESGDCFGGSVAIHGDTVVIAARCEDGNASSTAGNPNNNSYQSGAAYVFVRTGNTWTQEGYLKASNAGSNDLFGDSVSISGDTIVVGAYLEDGDASSTAAFPNDNANGAGAAYVFTRSGNIWTQQAYLKASNAEGSSGSSGWRFGRRSTYRAGDQFGHSVAISGETIIIGAPLEDGSASSTVDMPNNSRIYSGAAYIFRRSGTLWLQEGYLKASNTTQYDRFGYAVAISNDRAVVGAPYEDHGATLGSSPEYSSGAAYVFVCSGDAWIEEDYLKASNADVSDIFGYAVAISGDIVLVGAPNEEGDLYSTASSPNNNSLHAGAAYAFERSGSVWTEEEYIKASHAGQYDQFGYSLALSEDYAIIGAVGEDGDTDSISTESNDNASNAGAAYVFDLNFDPEIVVEHPVSSALIDGAGLLDFGTHPIAVSSSEKTITVSNIGDVDLAGISVSITGPAAGDFSVNDTLLGETIAPGASSTFSATFTPSQDGERLATIQIASNDSDENPFDIDLTGTGFTPVTFNDSILDAAVRSTLGIPTGPIHPDEMEALTTLDLSNLGVTDLDGLELAVNLTSLNIRGNTFTSPAGAWTILDGLSLHLLIADMQRPGGALPGILNEAVTDNNDDTFYISVDPANLEILYINDLDIDTDDQTNLDALQVFNDAGVFVVGIPENKLATWDSVEDIPDISASEVDGNTITFRLNFAPALGDELTVVKSTSPIDLISGEFTNLTHGQQVILEYEGTNYAYVASYYEGSGFDLVLLPVGRTVVAWGENSSGQLGDGSATDQSDAVLVDRSGVLSEKTVRAIATGDDHSIVLCSDGTLAAWGENGSGQLGDGNNVDKNSPGQVEVF